MRKLNCGLSFPKHPTLQKRRSFAFPSQSVAVITYSRGNISGIQFSETACPHFSMHDTKMFLIISYPVPLTTLTQVHTLSSCCISASPKDKPRPGNFLHSITPANIQAVTSMYFQGSSLRAHPKRGLEIGPLTQVWVALQDQGRVKRECFVIPSTYLF